MPYVVNAWAPTEAVTRDAADPIDEPAFQRWYRERTLPRTRTALILSAAIITAICLVDLALLPGAAPLTALVRACVMLPAVLIMLISLDRPALRHWSEHILFGGIVLIGWSSIVVGAIDARNGLPPVHTPGLVLILIYAYQFIGLSFRRTLAAGALITGLYVAAVLASGALGYTTVISMLFVAGANAIGAVQCHANWQAGRHTFMDSRRIEAQAMRDSLTGVANRRALDLHAASMWREMQRREGRLGVYLIDVDCFKQYNDTYGHQAGDQCLRRVALAVREVVRRPLDIAGRFGGEEFVVFLADPQPSYLALGAELLCDNVAALEIPHRSSTVAPCVTASVGAACVRPGIDCTSIEEALSIADKALYEAKSQGRNRFVVGEPALPPAETVAADEAIGDVAATA